MFDYSPVPNCMEKVVSQFWPTLKILGSQVNMKMSVIQKRSWKGDLGRVADTPFLKQLSSNFYKTIFLTFA